jgi:hypothetical protein
MDLLMPILDLLLLLPNYSVLHLDLLLLSFLLFLELVYLFLQLIDVILCVFDLSLRHGKFIEHFGCFGALISEGLLKLRLLSPI